MIKMLKTLKLKKENVQVAPIVVHVKIVNIVRIATAEVVAEFATQAIPKQNLKPTNQIVVIKLPHQQMYQE